MNSPKNTKPHAKVGFSKSGIFRIRSGNNADKFAIIPLGLKLDFSVGCCKQGIVTGPPDIFAWMEFGSPLFDNDAARQDGLTVGNLDTQSFGMGVATVSGASLSFFMCHNYFSSAAGFAVFLAGFFLAAAFVMIRFTSINVYPWRCPFLR